MTRHVDKKDISNKYPTTDFNKSLIEKYTLNKDNGLFLLTTPTGSGKTHAIIEFIKEHLHLGKKFIYTIPVKNNLEDFKNKLLRELDLKDHSRVLILKSIEDELLGWFKNDGNLEIEYISRFDEYKKVLSILNTYENLERNNVLELFNSKDLSAAGSKLIYRIKAEYKNLLKDEAFNNAKLIKEEALKIFEFFNIEKFDIILTTASKFCQKIKTIDSSAYLWEFETFENAYIFLDEFDSQKSYILKDILQKTLNNRVDLIELFRQMAKTFMNMDYYKKFQYEEDEFNEIKNNFVKIYQEKKLNYVLDSSLITKEFDDLPFLLDSNFFLTSLKNTEKSLFINIDEQSEQLIISDKQSEFSYPLHELIKSITGAINRYIIFTKNYVFKSIKKFKKDNLKDKIQLNQENFISAKIHDSIKIFGLSQDDSKYAYLKKQIENDLFIREKFKKQLGKENWNFYRNGSSLLNIKKRYLDSNIAEIEYLRFNTTPESLILNAASKCMVIGVSATANVKTVIKNFDINYLRNNSDFSELSNDEVLYMQNLYIESKNQKNRDFKVIIIDNDNNTNNAIADFCERNYSSVNNMNILNQIESYGIEKYVLEYYMNFIDCYKSFLLEDDIQSMLYFSNRYFKINKESNKFNYYTLLSLLIPFIKDLEETNEYIKYLKKQIEDNKNNLDYYIKNYIFFFEYRKDTEKDYTKYIEDSLKNNRKIFLYAIYERIGTGKNLEYEVDSVKKDFDAVYLEKPTNIIQNRFEDNVSRYLGIFQRENLFITHQINKIEYKRSLSNFITANKFIKEKYFKTLDYLEASMKVVIQALGRLHRTDSTSPMFIFVDNELVKIINSFDNKKIPLLPSMISIVDECKKSDAIVQVDKLQVVENGINHLSTHYNHLIEYALKLFSNPTNINSSEEIKTIWKKARKFVLKYPTYEVRNEDINKYMDVFDLPHVEFKNSYICYKHGDFKYISLSKRENYTKVEVSQEAANLHIIRNCPELREFAVQNNIALEFKYKNILIPVVFNNIYKGALGETFGKYIIEKYCDITLEELDEVDDEEYESFDYKHIKSEIYFDFKYYSQNTLNNSRQEIIQKANKKLEKNRFKKALIVNLFAEENSSSTPVINDESVVFIPYLVNSTKPMKPYIDLSIVETIKDILNGN